MDLNTIVGDIVAYWHEHGVPICEKKKKGPELSDMDKKTLKAMGKWEKEGSSPNSQAICSPFGLLQWHKKQGHKISGGTGRKRSGGGKKKYGPCAKVKKKKAKYPKEGVEEIAAYVSDDPDKVLDPRSYVFEFDDDSIVEISESGINQHNIEGEIIDYIDAIVQNVGNEIL